MPDVPPATSAAPEFGESRALADAAELFKVLGAEVRLAIVVVLLRAPQSVQQLVDTVGVRQPLVSQHLRVLRSARLVCAERRDRQRLYPGHDPSDHSDDLVTVLEKGVEVLWWPWTAE